ncbi:hypothetical protein B0H19DRAFT_1059645 [Mycena capillaripes]|nr:hypothetical protein B0H19DRAFT_1059645 [Mycena capillaripes]
MSRAPTSYGVTRCGEPSAHRVRPIRRAGRIRDVHGASRSTNEKGRWRCAIRAGILLLARRHILIALLSPTEPFTTTIDLPPGTHHFRFIVDGQTVVAPATETPNAVDDQGFIANYVAVPGPVGTTTPSMATTSPTAAVAPVTANGSNASSAATSATVSPSASGRARRRRPSAPVHPDGSFWAQSSAGGSGEDVRLAERLRSGSGGAHGHGHGGGGSWKGGAVWTCEIPEALIRAAEQEEAWLDAQAQYQQHQQAHHNHRHSSGGGDSARGDGGGGEWEQYECGGGGGYAESGAEGDDGEWDGRERADDELYVGVVECCVELEWGWGAAPAVWDPDAAATAAADKCGAGHGESSGRRDAADCGRPERAGDAVACCAVPPLHELDPRQDDCGRGFDAI